jgi:nucleotide-binding universal stress UspA family protein
MKVLCAVDGSEFARWGVEAVGAFTGRLPETVVLLHAMDTSALKAARRTRPSQTTRTLQAFEREGRRLLDRMQQTAKAAVSEATTAPRTKILTALAKGPAAETIVSQAGRKRATLVIVGSRGLSDIQHFLLGSISRRVVALASCPVLVVKRPMRTLERLVLAVDTSKHSRAAVDFLLSGFLPESTHVTLLSVVPPVLTDLAARVLPAGELEQLMAPARIRARELVAQFREFFLKEGYAVSTDVLDGHPSQTIVSFAEKTRADLIVVGSRGLTGSERVLLGSVSESVVKYAPCSVLVVHRSRT